MTADSRQARPSPEAPLWRDARLYMVFSITLMAVLGVSSITPAFPLIVEELQISRGQVGLLITAFTLPGVLLALVLGVLADRLGRKRVLVPSLLLFGVAGSACALTTSFELLLVLRFLQGTGAAALGALNFTLIGDLYAVERRATVMGYNSSVLSVGTAGYPAVGGALALVGWRYPFLLAATAVPIGLWVLMALDAPGAQRTETLRQYLRGAARTLRQAKVVALLVASVSTFVILYGAYLTYLPFLVGHRLGGSTLVIGLVMSASSLASALISSQLGRLSRVTSPATLVKIGFALFVVAMLLVPQAGSVGVLVLFILVFGTGSGLAMPSSLTILTSTAPIEYRAAFMAFNGMVLRVGQTLGPLVMGLVFAVWGLDAVYYAGAAVALATLPMLIALVRD